MTGSRTTITVCGEHVADLIAQPDGDYRAYPSGSPVNVAVALARLGEPVTMAARIGRDVFGRTVVQHLRGAGVDERHLVATSEPSAVAVVSFDEARRAVYDFWTEGAADWQWTDDELAVHPEPGCVAFHTGSLASWLPPGSDALLRLFERARAADAVTLTYDPNVRPLLLDDNAAAARDRIEQVVRLAHVVKVSDQDLAWLTPGEDVVDVARRWASLGADLVVVTLGPDGAVAARPGREPLAVPARLVTVQDTVGAGDTFMAGLLHGLHGLDALGSGPGVRLQRLGDDQLRLAMTLAAEAAAITCSREGCDPPSRAELEAAQTRPPGAAS